MRSRLRLPALICLTICFVALVWCVTALWMVDRAGDLLVSCLNAEAPVTTIQPGEDPPENGCWRLAEPGPSDAVPSTR